MSIAAVQVIAEELQGLFQGLLCMPEQLPQVCSHIAASSLQACQRHDSNALHPPRAQQPKQSSEVELSASVRAIALPEGGKGQVQLPSQPLTSAPVQDPKADSSGPGSALQSPIKEAFMHAVLQSLADICKDSLGDGAVNSTEQRPHTADASIERQSHHAHDQAGFGRGLSAEEKGLLSSHHYSLPQPAQRVAPRAVQKRHGKAPQDRRAATVGSKGPRGAGPLVRLKAALRKPRLPARSAAPLQTAAHAAGSDGFPHEALSHTAAQEDLSQGMHDRQRTAAEGPSALASTAPELARTSSWQTEQHEDTHISSCSVSASEGRVSSMRAEGVPERLFPVMQPPSAAEYRPLNIKGSVPPGLHGLDQQGSAAERPVVVEQLPQGRPHVRSGQQHKHPPRRRHRKATQPCISSPSTGKLEQSTMCPGFTGQHHRHHTRALSV